MTIFRRVFRLYVTLFRLYVRPVNIDVAACRLPVPVALYYFQNKCWEKNLFQLQPDWEQQVTMAPPSPSPRLQKPSFFAINSFSPLCKYFRRALVCKNLSFAIAINSFSLVCKYFLLYQFAFFLIEKKSPVCKHLLL